MRLSIQAICFKGLVRDNNEDALSIGGFFLRDDTSELSVTTPEEGSAREITQERFEDDIREAVADISHTLNERAYADGQQRPMGCTLTGVIWHYGKTYLVNAGDSRTYRFRDGFLRQLTTDETERGITGDNNASKLLLNCIGGGCEGYLRISSLDGKLLPGDILLVCSDGLSDMVSDDAIEEALANGATAEDLFNMACEGGGVDNISIILASIN